MMRTSRLIRTSYNSNDYLPDSTELFCMYIVEAKRYENDVICYAWSLEDRHKEDRMHEIRIVVAPSANYFHCKVDGDMVWYGKFWDERGYAHTTLEMTLKIERFCLTKEIQFVRKT